ncbi:hypothetical protein AB1283_00975 [Bacillus sp. S13(2024)]|uniref:hypothetical protein n=1 Tax=Bacillus sp. S13(2024) TaxID=3162885 RepID=UPI003D23BB96
MESNILFEEDQRKIEDAVMNYPMGSYQAGEVVRLSALLYDKGVNVENELKKLCNKFFISR